MRALRIVVATMCLAVAACGGNGSGGMPALTVSAATSLKQAFTNYGDEFSAAHARFSFAGSDQLAAQIRQGVKPDVFAAANTKLPDQLFAKGLVQKPTVFAANRLVVAVPARGAKVGSLADLTSSGVSIAMGSASVPVGSYTRKVLGGLAGAQRAKILANVRSNEPDVGGVVGKVVQGAVDAGFVYVTDVEATEGKLRAVDLPPSLRPQVAYGVAVVKGAKHPRQAKQFVDGLLSGAGREALDRAGFLPPPGT
jgi:molybdate transport system substrate-binding protein